MYVLLFRYLITIIFDKLREEMSRFCGEKLACLRISSKYDEICRIFTEGIFLQMVKIHYDQVELGEAYYGFW